MLLVKKFLNPKNDVAFKRVFGTKKNQNILIAMLNAVLKNQLHKPIQEVHFLSPIQEAEALAKKQSIVDVLCKDKDGCQYIIEMQLANAKGFKERAQYYASKAFISQMKEGEAYESLKEVIFLAFCSFPIFKGKKHYKSEHITIDKKTGDHDLDKMSFTFIDLIKFDKQRSKTIESLTLEEKFYYFLHHASTIDEASLHALIRQDPIIENAFKELERYAWTNEDILRYERELKRVRDNQACLSFAQDQGIEKGRQEGKIEGIKEGRREGKIEGIREGRREGKIEGIREGRREGKIEGIKEGRQEGIAKGRREGIKEGEEMGEKNKAKRIARELLLLGVDDKTIIASTELSHKCLYQIKNDIH